jgi:glycoside/pentoside/hexuronide:cation symporter, GPH family
MMNKLTTKISIREKLGYGLGDAASHFVWDTFGFWLLMFYTEVYGLSAWVAGLIIVSGRIVDMVTDPIMGIIADRTDTRWGKFRPYILWMAIPFGIFTYLALSTPSFDGTAKILYAVATNFAVMLIYTAINLPYSSLAGVMTSSAEERTSINSWRMAIGFIGMLVVVSYALTSVNFFGKEDYTTKILYNNSSHKIELLNNDSVLVIPSISSSHIDTVIYEITSETGVKDQDTIFICNENLKSTELINRLLKVKLNNSDEKGERKALVDIKFPNANTDTVFYDSEAAIICPITLNDQVINKQKGFKGTIGIFSIISIIFFLITFASTRERIKPLKTQEVSIKKDIKDLVNSRSWIVLFFSGIIFFIIFSMQNGVIWYYFQYYIGDANIAQRFNFLGTVALILAIPTSKFFVKRFDKKKIYLTCALLSGIFFVLMYFPRPDQLNLIFLFNILAKVSFAPTIPILWTMIADTADHSEWKTGRRATGLFFSASTFAQKAGWSIGIGITGFLLTRFGYNEGAAVQSTEAVKGIRLLLSVYPGILYIVGSLLMIFYTIDKKTCETVEKELDARRLKEESVN